MPRKTITRLAIRPIGPSIAYIPLTQGQFALVDAEDADALEQFHWFAHWNTCSESFYARHSFSRVTVSMQAYLLGLRGRAITADHINGVSLDNRRSNLRAVDKTTQQRNRRMFKNNQVGIKGVTKVGRRYAARIRVDGKIINLGSFMRAASAGKAYQQAVKKYFGVSGSTRSSTTLRPDFFTSERSLMESTRSEDNSDWQQRVLSPLLRKKDEYGHTMPAHV